MNGMSNAGVHQTPLRGTALCTSDLSWQPLVHAILQDCNLVTPEYEMKWNAVYRHSAEPDYSAMDRLSDFASRKALAMHGHTLWWHESIPKAQLDGPNGEFADRAVDHLKTTVTRYAGQMNSWDVVNEALEPAHGLQGGLRSTRFLDALGPDYISLAYHQVAALDPDAILVLNEMGLEYASPDAEQKRRLMLALLERELVRGTPIGCLGIQSHLTALEQPREHPEFRAFLREIRRMGLSVMVTEMDVSDHLCPRDRRQRDAMVADTYRAYLDLVLSESHALAVTTWGLADHRTWLNHFRPRADHARQRPLPLDSALRRKPAWHALQKALFSPVPDADATASGNPWEKTR